MKTKHFLISILTILSIIFLWFVYVNDKFYSSGTRALMMIMFVVFYFFHIKAKNKYFLWFLILFTSTQILDFVNYFLNVDPLKDNDYIYYIGNAQNILAYSALIMKVLKSMNLKEVIVKLPAHFVILIVLDIFCVTIITNAARDSYNGGFSIYEYSLEFLYNAVIMTFLTFAVLNYIHKVNKKAMNLLVSSIFFVFSEMIQLAYFYVSDKNTLLNLSCSLFLILALLFLFLQTDMAETEEVSMFNEHLEA